MLLLVMYSLLHLDYSVQAYVNVHILTPDKHI